MNINHNEIDALADIVAEKISGEIFSRMSPGRWMTLQEAMEYAKVRSVDTIRRWIDDGLIYGFKRSGAWIVDRESIDDWYSSEKY